MKNVISAEQAEFPSRLKTRPDKVDLQHFVAKMFQRF